MEREAIIKLIADGVNRAVSDLRKAEDAVGNVGKKGGAASGALQELGRVAFRVASDISKSFNDVRPIEFGRAGDEARKFSDSIARYSQRFGVDAQAMRSRFMGVGESIGVSSERVAGFARALSDVTQRDASGAVRDLGTYANETGRELEDVGKLGASLMTDLGVPVEKIGDSLQRLKDIASDFSTVGGSIALEKTLLRVSPMLAKLGGSLEAKAALIAELGKGKSPQVAEETASAVMGVMTNLPLQQLVRTMRVLKRDRTYNPFQYDEQGRATLKMEGLETLQKHWRKIPKSALYNVFGNTIEGVQAAEAFIHADLGVGKRREKASKAVQDALAGAGMVPLSEMTPSQIERVRKEGFGEFAIPAKTEAEAIRQRRAKVDAERANVELEVGEAVQTQRDKRNALYEGNRKAQAGIDTLKAYAPTTVERVLDITEAVGTEAITESKGKRSSTPTIEIGQASIDKMARAVAKSPIIAKPEKSSTQQAVEDNKAGNRAGANY
jgi:hypothetical protein